MTMRMLIDARHREETRVAVVKGNRVEEFDFESAERKQLKGNIYLAKVTRVEPSLQAAFVDYGGNRHGFLAFSEIHPDYYQIPKEDRDALLREEAEHAAEEEALRGEQDDDDDHGGDDELSARGDADEQEDGGDYDDDHGDHDHDHGHDGEGDADQDGEAGIAPARAGGGEDNAVENLRQKRMNLRRRYKIQDVIRRRQVLLVQVVKEERGNKGAALTTYLSLAGRYCVLMPNTSHGGGISRKISNAADRKRLKSIMADLQLPSSMGCIVRTAGLQRTKTEIKRDFDYLARLWDEIRENTLKSAAPALVHADSDLIKRAIRDIYNKDIDEVIVEGEEGFRAARSFMKLLMPGHAKKVLPYSDTVPLFQRSGVEDQLAAMYNPLVQLKSGGYLVINPTEALVSIDINSGRSTREHNIEQTAVNTNLEAAHEIARQLRLRDMAGLVVIDFIDMENSGNVRKVEKAMKSALANDRARIQIGRISSFGLFEMSRQRLRTGVLEASTRTCPHCEGTGLVRTASSAGLSALRMIEDEAARGRGSQICLRASQEAAFYVLNRKRAELAEIEDRYGVLIEIMPDGTMEGARMTVESGGPPPAYAPRLPAPIVIEADDDDDFVEEEEEEFEEEAVEEADEPRARDADRGDRAERPEREDGERGDGRRRRRRRRRGGRREEGDAAAGDEAALPLDAEAEGESIEAVDSVDEEEDEAGTTGAPVEAVADAGAGEEDRQSRRGRRGRRGGRRRGGSGGEAQAESTEYAADAPIEAEAAAADVDAFAEADVTSPAEDAQPVFAEVAAEEAASVAAEPSADEETARAPRGRRRPRARKGEPAVEATPLTDLAIPAPADESPAEAGEPAVELPLDQPVPLAEDVVEPAPKPRRGRRKAVPAADVAPEAAAPAADAALVDGEPAAPKPRRRRKAAAAPVDAAEAAEPAAAPAPTSQASATEMDVPTIANPAADEVAQAGAVDSAPEAPSAGEDAGNTDPAAGSDGSGEPPRRGWWQRTFG
jgi:ribonuclease E